MHFIGAIEAGPQINSRHFGATSSSALEAAPSKNQFTTWSPWYGYEELGRERKRAGHRLPLAKSALWSLLAITARRASALPSVTRFSICARALSKAFFASSSRCHRRRCSQESLNALMALDPNAWSALRRQLTALLMPTGADPQTQARVKPLLIPMHEVQMQFPAQIGDYTDFYASIHHATRVGKLFRPDNPLLPNYKYVPIGYHGRASRSLSAAPKFAGPAARQNRRPPPNQPSVRPALSITN